MNIDIWVIEKSNEQFIRGSYIEINFSKKKAVSGRIPFFVIGPFFTSHSICLNIEF